MQMVFTFAVLTVFFSMSAPGALPSLTRRGRQFSAELYSAVQTVTPLWHQSSLRIDAAPAVGPDGTIYTTTHSYLIAWSPDGTRRWSYQVDDVIIDSAPVLGGDGTIYFGVYTNFYAMKPDGTTRWKFGGTGYIPNAPAIGSDGTIYFGDTAGRLFALSPNGFLNWKLDTGGPITSSIAIATGGTLVFGSGSSLVAVSPGGIRTWTVHTGDQLYSSPALAEDGTIYVGSTDGMLYAVTAGGQIKWTFDAGSPIRSSPVLADDGTVYVGSDGVTSPDQPVPMGKLFAINPDGTKRWEFAARGSVRGGAAVAEDGTIYFAEAGYVHALNSDGTERWDYLLNENTAASSTIGLDGTLYVGASGSLSAFPGGSGPAHSSWPLFHRNVRHRGRMGGGASPVISLVSPADGTNLIQGSGAVLEARVTETDEPVSEVEFFDGTQSIGTDTQSPYILSLDGVQVGPHSLTATATDFRGISSTSAVINVSVAAPPDVAILSPGNGTTFLSGDDVTVTAEISNAGASIVRVDFYRDNVLFATDASSPFTGVWTNATVGPHSLTVQATDVVGNVFVSPPVQIDVLKRPPILLTLPTDSSTFLTGQVAQIVADVSGSTNPVARVDFYTGTNLIGSAASAPYGVGWSSSSEGPFLLTAKLVEDSGATVTSAPVTIWFFAPGVQTVDLSGFQSSAGLILQDQATVSSNRLHLNPLGRGKRGGAWLGVKRFIAGGFQCDFEFEITNRIFGGGAGFAFVIQNGPSPVLGNGGSGLGYDGVTNSLAIEFDTYQDAVNSDPAGNHIGVHSRWMLANDADEAYSIVTYVQRPAEGWNFADGQPHRVHVKYQDRAMSVYLEPFTSPVAAVSGIDFEKLLSLDHGRAWVGFTASTGTGVELHDLTEWTFSSPDAAPYLTVPPQGQTVVAGASAFFSVQATGAAPLEYQWLFEGNEIAGATNASLTVDPVDPASEGDYSVRVSNPVGSVVSLPAHLRVSQDGTKKWEFNGRPIPSSPAIGSDGTIYFGMNGSSSITDRLVALSKDGIRKWQFALSDRLRDAPAVGEDQTIYAAASHYLYAVNPDGTTRWIFTAPRDVYTSPAIGDDGTIYFGSADFRLYAVLPDGTEKWSFKLDNYILSSPAIGDDGTIYFGSLDHNLYALNPDGSLKWSVLTGNEIHSSPAIGADGTIYFTSYDGKLYAVNSDGTIRWTAGNAAGDSSPSLGVDGTVYLGQGNSLLAFTPAGLRKWTVATGDRVVDSPAVAADGTVYFGSMDGRFYAVNPDGTKRWDADAGAAIGESSPAIADDGTVYVGTYGGSLIAFNGSAPLAGSAWPMFRRDLQRTGRIPSAGPPVFTSQPVSTILGAGTNLFLSVTAIGARPLNYRWYRDRAPLDDGGNVSGTHTPRLSITGTRLDQAGLYSVEVQNPDGTNNSEVAVVSVLPFYRPPGTEVWRFQAGAEILVSPAVGTNGTIYFSAVDNQVYAVDPDGNRVWTFDAGALCASPSVALEGTIYVGVESPVDALLALNPDGTKKWEAAAGGAVRNTPAIGLDGTLYFVAGDGRLHAWQPDATPLWDEAVGDGTYMSSPAIGEDGTIYAAAGTFVPASGYIAGDFYAFYPDGTLKWHFTEPELLQSPPALGAGGTVYFGTGQSGLLYAFDSLGQPRWQYRSGVGIFSGPVLDGQGGIYFAHNEGTTFALDHDGALRWKTPGNNTPAVGADGTIYMPLNNGPFRAVDESGNERWNSAISTWGRGSAPTLTADGIIYVAWADQLVALQTSSSLAASSWPMFQHDARHTGNLQVQPVPNAIFTEPVDGAHFRPGQDIPISLRTLGGSGGIAGVDYYANGVWLGHVAAAPYSLVWSNTLPGTYQLTALVLDQNGVTGSSGAVTVVVNDPPTIQLVTPAPDAQFLDRDDILLTAQVSDPDGAVDTVDFYEGTNLLGTAIQPPFSYLWERVVPGTFQLSARATDNLGDSTIAPSVPVRVDAFPQVALTSPADGSEIPAGQSINFTATASDPDGTVARVDFFDGSRLLASTTGQPYEFSLAQAAPGEHVFFAEAMDDSGATSRALPVTVTVRPANFPPTVSFESPFDGAIFQLPAVVPISVRANDSDDAVVRIELSVNGSAFTSVPGGSVFLNWTNPPPGDYDLQATAVDGQGATSTRTRRFTVIGIGQSFPELTIPSDMAAANLWVPDGPVHALLEHAGTLYLGGAFHNIGQFVPGQAVVELSAPSPDLSYPAVDQIIDVLLDDGHGGFYVGGFFDSIGHVSRRGIAHINADKSVDLNFRADANDHVLTLALDGDTLYAGGEFDQIGGRNQRYVAALDAGTGAVKAWYPNPTGFISALAVSGNTIYMGGRFGYVGGKYRSNLAAVDAATAQALPWDPGADDFVTQLLPGEGRLFVVGRFGHIAGELRDGLAAFNLSSGALDGFNVGAASGARCLALDNGLLYVGGSFGLLAVDLATESTSLENVELDGPVDSVAVRDDLVYLAGEFSTVNGIARNKVAAVNRVTGSLSPLDLNPSGRFVVLGKAGDRVLGAGGLGLIKVPRRGLAAIDIATGFATGWDPGCDGDVYALAAEGDTLYVGGQFGMLGGQRRISLGAVDLASAKATRWRPDTDPQDTTIRSMHLQKDSVFVGGSFHLVHGLPRGNAAELELRTGDPTPWNPDADGLVRCLDVLDGTVYLGGDFTKLGGTSRAHLGAVNRFTGRPTAWNPGPDGVVNALVADPMAIYVAGGFQHLGGAIRAFLGAVDAETGAATSWMANSDGGIAALEKSGDILYVGGQFARIAGVTRVNTAAVSTRAASSQVLDWDPQPGSGESTANVLAVAVTDGSVFVGGDFQNVGDEPSPYLARLDLPARLSNPLRLQDGLFRMNFFGPLGYYYVFEASEDLKTWTPILTNRPPFTFEDVSALNYPQRFYRARPLQPAVP